MPKEKESKPELPVLTEYEKIKVCQNNNDIFLQKKIDPVKGITRRKM